MTFSLPPDSLLVERHAIEHIDSLVTLVEPWLRVLVAHQIFLALALALSLDGREAIVERNHEPTLLAAVDGGLDLGSTAIVVTLLSRMVLAGMKTGAKDGDGVAASGKRGRRGVSELGGHRRGRGRRRHREGEARLRGRRASRGGSRAGSGSALADLPRTSGLGPIGGLNRTAGDGIILYVAKVLEKVFGRLLGAVIVLIEKTFVSRGETKIGSG